MNKVLIQFKSFKICDSSPTIDEVAEYFCVDAKSCDVEFGVIGTDTNDRLYAALVNASAAEVVHKKTRHGRRPFCWRIF